MGKNSRKFAKNNQKKQGNQKSFALIEVKNKIQELKAAGQYNEALEQVITLLDMKNYDGDILFAAADTYFLTGDYERASVWINNTLDIDPGHIGAKILLARICMIQERMEDALNLIEFVLRTAKERLRSEEEEKVEEILDYFRYTQDLEVLAKSHPHVAEFMGIIPAEKVAVEEMRSEKTVIEENLEKDDQTDVQNPTDVKEEILKKDISFQEKITLLNAFSGAYYYENKVKTAKEFLLAAKMFDAHNEETIKNLIVLALEENNKELALEYASSLNKVDFSLIKMIKNN